MKKSALLAPPPQHTAAVKLRTARCPYCHDAVQADEGRACNGCLTRHHADCWTEGGDACSSCGSEALLVLQTPPPARATRYLTRWVLLVAVCAGFVGLGLTALILETFDSYSVQPILSSSTWLPEGREREALTVELPSGGTYALGRDVDLRVDSIAPEFDSLGDPHPRIEVSLWTAGEQVSLATVTGHKEVLLSANGRDYTVRMPHPTQLKSRLFAYRIALEATWIQPR